MESKLSLRTAISLRRKPIVMGGGLGEGGGNFDFSGNMCFNTASDSPLLYEPKKRGKKEDRDLSEEDGLPFFPLAGGLPFLRVHAGPVPGKESGECSGPGGIGRPVVVTE